MFLKRRLKCSFCRRPHTEVEKLVAGPRVFICDRCVAIAADIMREGYTPPPAPARRSGILVRIRMTVGRFFGSGHHRIAVGLPHGR